MNDTTRSSRVGLAISSKPTAAARGARSLRRAMPRVLVALGVLAASASPGLAQLAETSAPVAAGRLGEVVKSGAGDINLLLIPCMSCRWNQWEPFMQRNADRYTMYAVTVPGFGGTPVPDLPRNTETTPWRDNLLEGLSDLIDAEGLRGVTVVGHSWGSMVAVQLAARRADVVTHVVAVDGSIESTSWTPPTREERLSQASRVIERREPEFADAENWRTFNGVGLGSEDTVPTERARRALLYHGSFMATDRGALLQYWRENLLIDLTADLRSLPMPVLNVDALNGAPEAMAASRRQQLEDLAAAAVPDNVRTIFLYETRHFVMDQRPGVLDRLVADFLAGKPLSDFRPGPTDT